MRCTWSMLVAAVILTVARCAAGDTVILEESLKDGSANDSGYCGFVHNGRFVSGAGWQTTVMDSRIRFDLPYDVACGTLEVEFTNFDPIHNFRGSCGSSTGGGECYVNTIGAFEGTHGNNWDANDKKETQFEAQASCEQCFDDHPGDLGRDRHFKYKSVSWSWDAQGTVFNDYLPPSNDMDWEGSMSTLYSMTFTWNCAGPHFAFNDGSKNWTSSGTWSWVGDTGDGKPHVRYIFIGKDYSGGDFWVTDVIYTRVKVTEQSVCDCPAVVPDGGTPDVGVPDSGPSVDGGARDAGAPEDAGVAYDAGVEKDAGAIDDTGVEKDAGIPMDAGAVKDAGGAPPSDAGKPAADAGDGDYGIGCGCATLRVE